ncbi:protein ELYS homolog isoform X2 [Drosophila willistoni]|uniref:protein ELYS homolog isoform X2 n=1 Tax=Drosophila willistoni TaxID=7260 RepID=UPI001F07608F|nr:protein ELYS homolog isoform X2 [Drosophila willistoni]
MEWFEIELNGERTTTFPQLPVPWFAVEDADNDEELVELEGEESASLTGGIIFGGKWGWMTRRYASDATLIISCLETGYIIARHVFWTEHNDDPADNRSTCTSIRCVEELYPNQASKQLTILAICLETWTRGDRMNTMETHLAIYSVKWNQVLRRIHLDGILGSTLTFLSPEICWRTQNFRHFDGCLAIGSDDGTILIMDLNFKHLRSNRQSNPLESAPIVEIERISSQFQSISIESHMKKCRMKYNHSAVEINVANGGVRCLVVIDLIDGFAAGLDNGQIILYDLKGMKLLTILRTVEDLGNVSVERICCVVPPDDPKPCFYLNAMYQSDTRILALLHVISFSRSRIQMDRLHFEFQSSHTCARIQLDGPFCLAIGCSTASTAAIAGDNGTLLLVLCWYSEPEERNKMMLFDINQWYKDEMPYLIRLRDKPNCLAAFVLSERKHMGFGLQLKPSSILHFESLNRFDMHFYPNSLTFDCSLFNVKGYRYYAHNGIQSRFIDCLRQQKATLFLNPQVYHDDIIRLCLMPQFSELNPNATFSRTAMHEEILSVALEHKCLALLYDCARSWLDDSFLCNKVNPTELSLATLTNWIANRAKCIKNRCLELCQGIFDYNGYSLDERERKEFQVLSVQLKNLLELQTFIIKKGKSLLSDSVLDEYEANATALELVYNYQWLLYWFMQRDLLPEGNLMQHTSGQGQKTQLKQLQRDYDERRVQRKKANMPLYIDTLLQQNGLGNCMNDKQSYPPTTMKALMQMMLSTDAQLEQKHEVVLYLLMDLDRINQGLIVELDKTKPPLQEKKMSMVLSKQFHIFFNLREEVIKSVQSFWHLDRGDYWQAIDGLYDGIGKIRHYEDWQMKLIIENLLAANATRLAMRLVIRPPGPVSFPLYLRVLLANDRISEAFHYARLYDDDKGRPLLEHFFRHFINLGKFKVLTELSLREDEEQLIYRLLRETKTRKTDSVHLILLLQKFKYVEAVSFMDEVAVERQQAANELSNTILSAYRSTMAPVTQSIAGKYLQIRNRLDGQEVAANQSPDPFSCQLVKQSASSDMVGGIFQSSALSTHWATADYEASGQPTLTCQNVPFLRNSQHRGHILDGRGHGIQHRRHIVRSVPYQVVSKRQRERQNLETSPKPSNYSLQPRKRRRLLGEQLIADLQEFINRKKFEEQAEKSTQGPILGQSSVEPRGIFKRYPIAASSSSTEQAPQDLNRSERSQEFVQQSSNVTENVKLPGKSFFFPPPIPLDEAAAVEQTDEDETDEIIMEIQSRGGQHHESNESEPRKTSTKDFYFAPPIPLDPPVVRVAEEETEMEEEHDEILVEFQSRGEPQEPPVGQADSESSESDEEFMSPLSSANVSLVREPEPLPMAPPTGPQPRHPLLYGRTESSSGFGSFSATSMRLAHTASSRDFVPTVCSSKMGETTTYIKISERTTICGEMPEITEPSQILMPTSTTTNLGWSMPTRAGQLQDMLDTTLGMSSYDITSMEQRQEEGEPIQEMETEEEDQPSEREFEREQEERVRENMQFVQQEDQYEAEEQQQQTIELEDSSYNHPYIMTASEEDVVAVDAATVDPAIPGPAITNEEQLSSPTFSVSSGLSDNSSSEVQPLAANRLQEDPMYSIVVESTGSITTSRSVTHTPTSFLPSDTNVSQNSSPRAAHGVAGSGPGGIGEASPRSLYRANSLETVDDLDTTKGSLDDDDEEQVEDEDDCVIALDGTEVRGYVPRPQQVAGCSSAELFAFKDDDAAALGLARPNASLSLGATANSDSVIAETINLDTDDDEIINNEMAIQSDNQLCNNEYVEEPDEVQEDDSLFIVSSQPLEEMQEEEMQEEEMQGEEMQEEEMQEEEMQEEEMQEEEIQEEEYQEEEYQEEQIQEEEIQEEEIQEEEIQEEEIQEEEIQEEEIQEEEIQEEEIQEEEIQEEEIQEEEIQEEDNESMGSQQLGHIEEAELSSDDIVTLVMDPVLERIQEEDEEEEEDQLQEMPDENEDAWGRRRQISESEEPPLKLAVSEDENEAPSYPLTPIRILRSHDRPRVATPTVDGPGMVVGVRRLRQRLHSGDFSTISPNPLQSPSSNRLTRATSTPPSSSISAGLTPSKRLRRISSQKHLFDAIDEQNNSRDFTQSPGPQTRSRSRLSLEAEPAPAPPQAAAAAAASTSSYKSRTAKRSHSTTSKPVIPPSAATAAPTYRRKLRSSSEPPTSIFQEAMAKAPIKSNRSKRRPSSTEEPSGHATRGTFVALDDQASTSRPNVRVLRARKSESERAPTPPNAASTEEINANPTSEDPPAENNEASVPPKKRGRPRNKIA